MYSYNYNWLRSKQLFMELNGMQLSKLNYLKNKLVKQHETDTYKNGFHTVSSVN